MMYSILLVDDEPEILAAWRLILESEGYAVPPPTNSYAQYWDASLMKPGGADLFLTTIEKLCGPRC